jgi:hypothetical protein
MGTMTPFAPDAGADGGDKDVGRGAFGTRGM